MKNFAIIFIISLAYLVQRISSSEFCKYYPYGRYSTILTTYCSDRCCSTSFPSSATAACCTSYDYDDAVSWWVWLIIGLVLLCCSPCIIIAIVVICIKCCKSKKNKGQVISKAPTLPYGNTTINITTETKPPAYMANNLNQQSGMNQPVNPTYNSFAQPVNNMNFSSNIGSNGDQILPVLPPSTNPQFVDQSFKAY